MFVGCALTILIRALDIFGGTGVRFEDLISVDKEAKQACLPNMRHSKLNLSSS